MNTPRPIIVGEVLFDHFPEGRKVLGGAPFNVAWNLRGLGLQPSLITAVGDDEEGRTVLQRMIDWGMATGGVQVSEQLPTGQARVEVIDGEPGFNLLDEQAYDDIRFPAEAPNGGDHSLLYVGSLALRREPSRSTIRRLMTETGLPRFVDINIRRPWFSMETAAEVLEGAAWTKLNAGELEQLTSLPCGTRDQIPAAVEKLRDLYGGRQFFVTCGASGAVAIDQHGEAAFVDSPPPRPVHRFGRGRRCLLGRLPLRHFPRPISP